MAPEQITGDVPISEATDVWAVGAVLFTCLVGRAPFVHPKLTELLATIVREPAPSLGLFRDLPRPVAELVARALRTHPAHRYASATDMLGALAECRSDVSDFHLVLSPVSEVLGHGASVCRKALCARRKALCASHPSTMVTTHRRGKRSHAANLGRFGAPKSPYPGEEGCSCT